MSGHNDYRDQDAALACWTAECVAHARMSAATIRQADALAGLDGWYDRVAMSWPDALVLAQLLEDLASLVEYDGGGQVPEGMTNAESPAGNGHIGGGTPA